LPVHNSANHSTAKQPNAMHQPRNRNNSSQLPQLPSSVAASNQRTLSNSMPNSFHPLGSSIHTQTHKH
jgi:hypothetical protein